MSYRESIDYLHGLQLFGARMGLESVLQLADLAGNPHRRLRFIHVAGTNGKGSTCAILESIYRRSGLRVGLFTSPHLVSFSERIQVNRFPIAPQDVERLTLRIQQWINRGWSSSNAEGTLPGHPTFFEAVTVMALIYFEEQACDLVVWETGLGGRLDATNIVMPLASVITNVQWDHQQWLGATLREIAFEKAGIIKESVPALTSALDPEALEVLAAVAASRKTLLQTVIEDDLRQWGPGVELLPLIGRHQRLNAALALAVVEVLREVLPVSPEAVSEGLARVQWRGRFEELTRTNGHRLIIDGAHNPAGAEALGTAFAARFPGKRCCLIFGVFADKDWRSISRILAPIAHRILLTPVQSERGARPEDLRDGWSSANPLAKIELARDLRGALAATEEEPLTVVAGSLFLVGEALEVLESTPRPATHAIPESALNEWHGAGKNAERRSGN